MLDVGLVSCFRDTLPPHIPWSDELPHPRFLKNRPSKSVRKRSLIMVYWRLLAPPKPNLFWHTFGLLSLIVKPRVLLWAWKSLVAKLFKGHRSRQSFPRFFEKISSPSSLGWSGQRCSTCYARMDSILSNIIDKCIEVSRFSSLFCIRKSNTYPWKIVTYI